MRSEMYKGYIFAILSAVIFGCMPLMAKYIYAEGVTPTTLVFLRNLLALPNPTPTPSRSPKPLMWLKLVETV